jgi:hypothetical protein
VDPWLPWSVVIFHSILSPPLIVLIIFIDNAFLAKMINCLYDIVLAVPVNGFVIDFHLVHFLSQLWEVLLIDRANQNAPPMSTAIFRFGFHDVFGELRMLSTHFEHNILVPAAQVQSPMLIISLLRLVHSDVQLRHDPGEVYSEGTAHGERHGKRVSMRLDQHLHSVQFSWDGSSRVQGSGSRFYDEMLRTDSETTQSGREDEWVRGRRGEKLQE